MTADSSGSRSFTQSLDSTALRHPPDEHYLLRLRLSSHISTSSESIPFEILLCIFEHLFQWLSEERKASQKEVIARRRDWVNSYDYRTFAQYPMFRPNKLIRLHHFERDQNYLYPDPVAFFSQTICSVCLLWAKVGQKVMLRKPVLRTVKEVESFARMLQENHSLGGLVLGLGIGDEGLKYGSNPMADRLGAARIIQIAQERRNEEERWKMAISKLVETLKQVNPGYSNEAPNGNGGNDEFNSSQMNSDPLTWPLRSILVYGLPPSILFPTPAFRALGVPNDMVSRSSLDITRLSLLSFTNIPPSFPYLTQIYLQSPSIEARIRISDVLLAFCHLPLKELTLVKVISEHTNTGEWGLRYPSPASTSQIQGGLDEASIITTKAFSVLPYTLQRLNLLESLITSRDFLSLLSPGSFSPLITHSFPPIAPTHLSLSSSRILADSIPFDLLMDGDALNTETINSICGSFAHALQGFDILGPKLVSLELVGEDGHIFYRSRPSSNEDDFRFYLPYPDDFDLPVGAENLIVRRIFMNCVSLETLCIGATVTMTEVLPFLAAAAGDSLKALRWFGRGDYESLTRMELWEDAFTGRWGRGFPIVGEKDQHTIFNTKTRGTNTSLPRQQDEGFDHEKRFSHAIDVIDGCPSFPRLESFDLHFLYERDGLELEETERVARVHFLELCERWEIRFKMYALKECLRMESEVQRWKVA